MKKLCEKYMANGYKICINKSILSKNLKNCKCEPLPSLDTDFRGEMSKLKSTLQDNIRVEGHFADIGHLKY